MPRRRPTWTERGFVLVYVALFAAGASAQPPADGPQTPSDGPQPEPAAPSPLDRFLADVETLQAEFEQRVYSASGTLVERYTGTMAVERPGRFRWHYAPPMELILWSDGESFNTYDVELEQQTIAPLEDYAASAPVLLSGGADLDDVFRVVERYSAEGLDWVALEPVTDDGANVASLAIGFADDALRRIEFVDSADETTRIDLTNLAVNVALPDALFEYEPPPGATVMGGN